MTKKKRTAEEIRAFVKKRVEQESAALNSPPGTRPAQLAGDGAFIDGNSLARAKAIIDKLIPDPTDQKALFNTLTAFPKYTGLSMMLSTTGRWVQKYPEIIIEIADEATAVDSQVGPFT